MTIEKLHEPQLDGNFNVGVRLTEYDFVIDVDPRNMGGVDYLRPSAEHDLQHRPQQDYPKVRDGVGRAGTSIMKLADAVTSFGRCWMPIRALSSRGAGAAGHSGGSHASGQTGNKMYEWDGPVCIGTAAAIGA